MLETYRRLFALPGSWRFSLAAFILRLPIAMLYIALVLFVVAETDSYTIAGALSMAASIVVTIVAPLWSRAADQFGQSRILMITAPLHILFMGLFVLLLKNGAPTPYWFTAALLFEAFVIGSGQMVRRRWIHVIGENRKLIDTAYSFEAFVDEVIFTSGPMVSTILAATFAPEYGIFAAMFFVAIGALTFGGQRETEPPRHPLSADSDTSLLIRSRFIRALFIPLALCGSFFSSAGLVVVGYVDEYGVREWSGIFIAIWSLSSGLSALVTGTIHWRKSESVRFLGSLVALFILTIPMVFAALIFPGNLVLMGIALFLNGAAIAPLLASGFAAAERSVDEKRKTEVLAWAGSALSLGSAFTPAITGYIIDNQGISVAFMVPITCTALALLAIAPFARLWRSKVSELSS